MSSVHFEPLSTELRDVQLEMEAHARSYGLDFFPTIFEVVDAHELNEIAAYGGFPTRYPHWRFGMQYEELSKEERKGLRAVITGAQRKVCGELGAVIAKSKDTLGKLEAEREEVRNAQAGSATAGRGSTDARP